MSTGKERGRRAMTFDEWWEKSVFHEDESPILKLSMRAAYEDAQAQSKDRISELETRVENLTRALDIKRGEVLAIIGKMSGARGYK